MTAVAANDPLADPSRGEGTMSLRYEDVAQNGRLKVLAMPHATGAVAFGKLWNRTPLASSLRSRGILPILSRLRVESLAGPLSVFHPIEIEAWYQLGHVRGPDREVQRVLLNCGADLYAPRGRTHDPQPEGAGDRIQVGRVLAEHVFTRPFAAPEQRRVGLSDIDEPELLAHELPPLARSPSMPPEPSVAMDADYVDDPAPVVFGLSHTDSNQHVNSLAYIPVFEAAALRRIAHHGYSAGKLFLREVELVYRKPCFAEEHMTRSVRLYAQAGALLSHCQLGPDGARAERAHCACTLTFELT